MPQGLTEVEPRPDAVPLSEGLGCRQTPANVAAGDRLRPSLWNCWQNGLVGA